MTAAKITENERRFLNALTAGEILRPYQMRYRWPRAFEGKTDAGLHRTGASLVRKGLVIKRPKESGVAYQIAPAGRRAVNEANRRHQCPACDHPGRHTAHTCGLKGLQAMLPLGSRR